MAVTIDNDLILARTRLTNSASTRQAYVTYACADEAGGTAALTIANALQARFATNLAAQLDSNVTIGPTSVLVGRSPFVPTIADSNVATSPGTNASASPAPNTAMLVKKTTGLAGRRERGRLYLPWFGDEGTIDEAGVIAGASVAGAQTRFSAWLAGLDTDGYHMVIANRIYDLPWDNPARSLTAVEMGTAVNALVVQALCGTQRRRMRS